MKIVLLSLMTTFVVSFNYGSPKEMNRVVIAGRVINQTENTPQAIKFNFCNPLIPESQSVQINGDGEFIAKEFMIYTQNMTVNYFNYFINLYVEPGDSIFLTIDAMLLDKPNYAWLTIGGDHALLSTQLNLCTNFMYNIPGHSNNLELAPQAMVRAVKQDYDQYLEALTKYVAEYKIDPIVENWMKLDLKYLISNQIVGYGSGKNTTIEKSAPIAVFSDPFFNMHNPENFQSMLFPYHLDYYVSSLFKTDTTIAYALGDNKPIDALKKGMSLILKEPQGECRDYMLNKYMSFFVKNYNGILDSIEDVSTIFTSKVYYESLIELSERNTKPVFPETFIKGINYMRKKDSIVSLPSLDPFSHFKSKYPGKVLYIDVYATWCGPCIDELKYTPALYESMKDKDVVFLNLCLQSSEVNWKKFVKDRNVEGENYFFNDDATKLFMGAYKLLGYPSYILIDKTGEIVTTNAPRPSDGKALKKTFANLLE